jgi:hypothetical protein
MARLPRDAHRRACHRFANGVGINGIGFTPLHVGLHIGGRHETDFMAKASQFPRPVMGPGAGFHARKAGTQPGKEHQNLRPPQLTAADNRAFSVHSVNLEDILGKIEADGGRLVRGWLLLGAYFHRPTLAQRDAAGGAIHTINGGQFPLSQIPRVQAPPKKAKALSWASKTISCVSRG